MEFTSYNARTTRATRSELDTVLCNPERVVHQATVDVGAKTPLFETTLLEPAVMANDETAQSFMDRVMVAHTGTNANEDMVDTVLDSDFDAT